MLKVGITGQAGFIGSHLFNTLRLYPQEFETVPFTDEYFRDEPTLNNFVSLCDVIVHLAAVNRHSDPGTLYKTNVKLTEQLIRALETTSSKPHLLFSSSTQEERENPYGLSKKKGRMLLAEWAAKNGGGFTGLIIPNVFGPFGNPYYNSVIATFSHQLNRNEMPRIEIDAELKLIYVGELASAILRQIRAYTPGRVMVENPIPHTSCIKVSAILEKLRTFHSEYALNGIIPLLNGAFEHTLFNTFRSYMDIPHRFPVKYHQNTDQRGSFVELLRNGSSGGQVSFSTTRPGITRGNHFHTRKVERFSVIKGEARIQLRRIGTTEVFDFILSGSEPSYVDMPVWYTHNITNTGEEDLYTVFWINECYDPGDPDTFIEAM